MSDPLRNVGTHIELCYSNCPRVHDRHAAADDWQRAGESETEAAASSAHRALPVEFQSDAGRRLFPDRTKPCYLFIRLTRPHCRNLRNFIVANSTKLQVAKAEYCGIATQVFNVQSDALEPLLSVGLVRFGSTAQAYQFVTNEPKMSRNDFLGGKFDIWNLTLGAPDRSIVRHPIQPKNFVNSMNVFHFVHVRGLALLPDGMEMSPEAQRAAVAASAEVQARLESSLNTVEGHGGRLVVKATAVARMRGLPFHNPSAEPQISVYMSQWAGVRQFWDWLDSPSGSNFNQLLMELTDGSHDSLLFTVCLDFVDLV